MCETEQSVKGNWTGDVLASFSLTMPQALDRHTFSFLPLLVGLFFLLFPIKCFYFIQPHNLHISMSHCLCSKILKLNSSVY